MLSLHFNQQPMTVFNRFCPIRKLVHLHVRISSVPFDSTPRTRGLA